VQKEQLTVLQKEGDQQRKIAIAQELFITIGAKDACIEVMNLHHNKALEALMSINGNEDIKRQLHAVAEYLLVRTV
jgi:geranylgeranyl pyrophosphate synthase